MRVRAKHAVRAPFAEPLFSRRVSPSRDDHRRGGYTRSAFQNGRCEGSGRTSFLEKSAHSCRVGDRPYRARRSRGQRCVPGSLLTACREVSTRGATRSSVDPIRSRLSFSRNRHDPVKRRAGSSSAHWVLWFGYYPAPVPQPPCFSRGQAGTNLSIPNRSACYSLLYDPTYFPQTTNPPEPILCVYSRFSPIASLANATSARQSARVSTGWQGHPILPRSDKLSPPACLAT